LARFKAKLKAKKRNMGFPDILEKYWVFNKLTEITREIITIN